MQYRKLKGTALFDGIQLKTDTVLVTGKDGVIEDFLPFDATDEEVELYEGVILPGLINAHCHLELSHLKGVVPQASGLVDFLTKVVRSRNNNNDIDKESAIHAADEELYKNGVLAVADICNTADTVQVKNKSQIEWHNLVEVINFYDNKRDTALSSYQTVIQQFEALRQQAILTPHAPYTVSAGTFAALNKATAGGIISIHNQETEAENELFRKGTGDFLRLYEVFGHGASPFAVSGKSSLQTWLPYFTEGQTIILVHNTYTTEEDIIWAKEHARMYGLQLVWCFCPNANLYIEGRLPNVALFIKHDCHVVIGTDSYSSNHQLSIGAELKTLKQHFPDLSITTLLRWATSNGSAALGLPHLGHFKEGTQPGVVLMQEDTFEAQRLM